MWSVALSPSEIRGEILVAFSAASQPCLEVF